MRALIITVLPPPDPQQDRHGVYQRLQMFTQALGRLCRKVEVAHFVDAHTINPQTVARASITGSHFWQTPVTIRLLPIDQEPRKLWQTALAAGSVRYRGDFRPFLGAKPVEALRLLLEESPDIIFAHRLPAMAALSKAGGVHRPIFFDLDDVEHMVKIRSAETETSRSRRWRRRIEVPAVVAAERRAIDQATLTFICSDHDLDRLADQGFHTGRVLVAPNAVNVPDALPALHRQASALFIGNYGHAPNADAAERLITCIWPLVRARLPQAVLLIAGANADRIPSFDEKPEGVVFTGFAQDLDALYAKVRIVCCPLRKGSGTRIKLIEAAGMGKPIVATQMACEGLKFHNGLDCVINDHDAGLAEGCIRLLTDDEMAARHAKAAYSMARAFYGRRRIMGQIQAAMSSVLTAEDDKHDVSTGSRDAAMLPRIARMAYDEASP